MLRKDIKKNEEENKKQKQKNLRLRVLVVWQSWNDEKVWRRKDNERETQKASDKVFSSFLFRFVFQPSYYYFQFMDWITKKQKKRSKEVYKEEEKIIKITLGGRISNAKTPQRSSRRKIRTKKSYYIHTQFFNIYISESYSDLLIVFVLSCLCCVWCGRRDVVVTDFFLRLHHNILTCWLLLLL